MAPARPLSRPARPSPTPPATDYVYRPPLAAARSHLGRYPRHYGVLALFLLAMALVPRVGGPGLIPAKSPGGSGRFDTVPAASAAGTGARAVDIAAAPARGVGTNAGQPTDTANDRVAVADTAGDAMAVPEAPTAPTPPEPTPGPAADGLSLPPPPASPIPIPPTLPDETEPVLEAITPITGTGCSAVGLAGVVLAVAGPSAPDEVPVADLLPYLATLYAACATFPPPSATPTICAIDEEMQAAGYPTDVSGLAATPNVIGMGVDILAGIEGAVGSVTGQDLGVVAEIADRLGCHPDLG